ncbi:MAG: HYR domain-containing protein, partial [Actinomycetota bacterium]
MPGDLACGPHEIVATVTDYAGNSTTDNTIYNKDDCTPPVTTDDAPSGWQNTDVTVTLTCTDNFSGCASTTYEVNGGATQTGNTVLLTADGVYTITYRSKDVAGNVETTKTATVMIDKTPPVVTTSADVTVEATGPSGADVTYTSGATDALSGVVGSVTCLPPSGSTFPLGATVVTCSATDLAGNTGTGTLTVTVVDTTPPVVTGTDTTVEATGPSGAVATFTSSATDIVDGAVATTCLPPSGSTFPLGATVVTCSATDLAGNTGTGTLTVTVVDTTAPVVTYISPVDTIYDTTSPPITGTATDDVGVTSASAVIDGTTTVSCTVDGLGNVSCPTSSLAYGWHTAVIYASDAAGNTGSSTTA